MMLGAMKNHCCDHTYLVYVTKIKRTEMRNDYATNDPPYILSFLSSYTPHPNMEVFSEVQLFIYSLP